MRTRGAARITKGQVAAVCGLILIGVPYVKACRIVAASRKQMPKYVPPDWRRSPMKVRVRQMSRKQYGIYRKLVPVLGRNRAVEQALAPT